MLKKIVIIAILFTFASVIHAGPNNPVYKNPPGYPALNNPTGYIVAQHYLGNKVVNQCSKQFFFHNFVKLNKHNGLLWMGSQMMKKAKFWSEVERRKGHEIYYTRLQLKQATGKKARKLAK